MAEDTTAERLLTKSKESFALAVELYNRPTLKYHAEACSIFLCNAWELMLKAHLINKDGLETIYYPDEPERTISLIDCLKRTFSNAKSPLRVNMDQLIKFRNTNTHFITDEYELFYGPFLQAAVTNYADQLEKLHNESVGDIMPANHLTLAVRRGSLEPETIRAKYDAATAEKLLRTSQNLADVAGNEGNESIAAIFETNLRLVKKEGEADLNVYIDKNAEPGIRIVKDIKDALSYYPNTPSACVQKINKRLKANNIDIYLGGAKKSKFTMHDFNLFTKGHKMKGDDRYSYDRSAENEKNSAYVYSQSTVDFIFDMLKRDPRNYLDKLKHNLSSENK